MIYDEFRVVLTPDTATSGSWNVLLDACPPSHTKLAGEKGAVQVAVTRAQLDQLRSQTGWPNTNRLKAIGRKTWESLMNPGLAAAFQICLTELPAGHGLRLVVSMIGEEPQPAAGAIRLQELPLEALYSPDTGFLAMDPATPVSRSLKFRPDRDPTPVRGPLRILVLVATPTDQLQAVLQNEQAIIQNALQPLVNRGVVEWEFCDPPTPMELLQRLKKNPHVLHFVGHGAFDYDGDDPSPRSYLCLEKPDRTSAKVDADTLDMMLRNSGVRLVVLSACSTAAPTPKQVGDTVGPFDGVAQRLVAGFSTVSAAVAMQFDLESEAAEVFNETLYNRLLMPDAPLDAVVAECRGAMMSAKKLGHRCWVNPVLYWRCKEGKLFSFQSGQAPLNDQTRAELLANEMLLTTWLAQIAKMWAMPPAMRQAFTTFFADYLQNVEQTLQTRCQLLGEAVRLRGGPTSPGQPVACPLILHLPAAAQIGDVQVGLSFPANKVALQGVGPGGQTPGSIPLTGTAAPGVCTLLVQNASHGAQWPAGDHELAVVNFVTQPGVTDDRLDLSVSQAQIHKDGAVANFGTVNAFLFVG